LLRGFSSFRLEVHYLLSYELSVPGPRGFHVWKRKCLFFGNWHVLSSCTSIYSCLFFCTLLQGLLFKISYWPMELVQLTCYHWFCSCLLVWCSSSLLYALSSSYFFPNPQTFWYHTLWTPMSWYHIAKKGFFLMLFQMICHKKYHFFVSVFSSSCSRDAKDNV